MNKQFANETPVGVMLEDAERIPDPRAELDRERGEAVGDLSARLQAVIAKGGDRARCVLAALAVVRYATEHPEKRWENRDLQSLHIRCVANYGVRGYRRRTRVMRGLGDRLFNGDGETLFL